MAKNKKGAILLVQLALVGFFSVGMYSYMQKELTPVNVYVYKNRIAKNSEIEMADLTVKSIPANAKTAGFLTEKEVENIKKGLMVVTTDVEPGQYAYSSQVQEGRKADPFETMELTNYRKISIPVSYETAAAGEISRGDRVDLAFVGKTVKGNYSKTFLQNVLVYSVTTGEGFEYVEHTKIKKSTTTAEDTSSDVSADDLTAPSLVTVAVPLKDAEEILARMQVGEDSIISRFETSENVNSVGFSYESNDEGRVTATQKAVEVK